MPTPNSNCQVCGNLFYAAPGHVKKGWAKTCSFTCRSLFKPNPRFEINDVACKQCGKHFHVKPSQQKSNKGKIYCSPECKSIATTEKKSCLSCKKEVVVPKSRANKFKHCSAKCRHEMALCGTTNAKCKSCGKDFYCKPSELKRGIGAGAFCSVGCMTGSRGKIKLADGMYASHLELEMYSLIKSIGLDAGMVREYKFHEIRKWRLDFAWPDKKIGIEVQGGIWMGKSGGHTSGSGRARDMEKLNSATMLGWRVLEVSAKHLRNGQAQDWVKRILA